MSTISAGGPSKPPIIDPRPPAFDKPTKPGKPKGPRTKCIPGGGHLPPAPPAQSGAGKLEKVTAKEALRELLDGRRETTGTTGLADRVTGAVSGAVAGAVAGAGELLESMGDRIRQGIDLVQARQETRTPIHVLR